MKYTQVNSDAFEHLQLNAGILVDDFTPATGVIGNILGATTGGITFNSNPAFEDFGADVDNVPANTMDLKRITSYDPAMSGTFVECTEDLAKQLVGAGDLASGKITPRAQLLSTDFDEVWWIGDYSNVNTGTNAGYIAIHLLNALNTAGFQITSTKDGKGNLAFDFHGHYSLTDMDTVPFEIYVKEGTA